MNTIRALLLATAGCLLAAPLSLEARPVQQIEADIKLVNSQLRACEQRLDALGKSIAAPYDMPDPPPAGALKTLQAEYAKAVECFNYLKNKLDTLQKELAAAPPNPTVMPPERNRLLGQLIAKMFGEIAAAQAKLREYASKLRALEARAKRK